MAIKLSVRVAVKAIKKPTKSKMLKDCRVGDILLMEVDASPAGSNRGSTYATYIKVTNLRTQDHNYYSFNQLSIVHRALELEEV